MKTLSDAIQAIVIILTAMLGLYLLIAKLINNAGIKAKKLDALERAFKELGEDIKNIKSDDKHRDEKIKQLKEHYEYIVKFLIAKE